MPTDPFIAPTPDELNRFLAMAFPSSMLQVTATAPRWATLRLPIDTRQLRPGGTVSGPTMMGLIDAALYMAIFATIGITPMAVTSNLNIHFLRRPTAHAALVAQCRLLKVGRNTATGEVSVFSEGDDEPVAHATGTYALPPKSAQTRCA